jgi:hypothetical protein
LSSTGMMIMAVTMSGVQVSLVPIPNLYRWKRILWCSFSIVRKLRLIPTLLPVYRLAESFDTNTCPFTSTLQAACIRQNDSDQRHRDTWKQHSGSRNDRASRRDKAQTESQWRRELFVAGQETWKAGCGFIVRLVRDAGK